MKKRVVSEFMVGVVLFAAIIIGGIFWLHGSGQSKVNKLIASPAPAPERQADENVADNSCRPHYYEGEAEIQGWLAQDDGNSSGSEVIMQIKDEDIRNLPVTDSNVLTNFTVKLIDPTDEVKNSLRLATKEKPATVVVRGYAEICQKPPIVSLRQATIAFKKS